MFRTDEMISRADLLFQIKLLRDRVEAFENGEKYVRMKEEHQKARDADHRTIRRLEHELERARKESIRIRELWYGTCEDVIREKEKELAKKEKQIQRLEKELDEAHETIKEMRQKYVDKAGEIYDVETQLAEEREKNKELTSRLNRDYRNSSRSSAMSPNHPLIQNGREKTGRRAGGQPGHIHHGRKWKKPTDTYVIPTPEENKDTNRYKPTGKTIRKQLIKVKVGTEVIEYQAEEYRDQLTGQRVHAAFPDGLTDDVTYDASVKALAYMINNDLYTSIDKTRLFLKDITHGDVDVSNGFVCNLAKEFSERTECERGEIFLKMAASPILHADFTFGRRNGKQTAVIITATEEGVLYQGREKKGDEGVEGSPLEYYEGTLVSDHEAAIIKHGSRHQECLSHLLRYAKSGVENEPERTWHEDLAKWIGDAVKYWNEVDEGKQEYDPGQAKQYIDRLKDVLKKAEQEYEEDPPTKYSREGFNTYKRMAEKMEDYELFLRDPEVPPTNNLAERYGRKFKRKSHQVMSFRSQAGVNHFCDGLTITESVKARGENVFDAIMERFQAQA